MIARLLEWITGKDDLERVASRGDLGRLRAYLKVRKVFIPKRPIRFLDARDFTPEDLLALAQEEAEDLAKDSFDPWVMDVDGQQRLPAFSSRRRMVAFSGKVSQALDQVFSLGCVEILLADVVDHLSVDFIDLNQFSRHSWEIGIGMMRANDA